MESALQQRQRDWFTLSQVQSQLEEQRLKFELEIQRRESHVEEKIRRQSHVELESLVAQHRQQLSSLSESHRDELKRLMSSTQSTVQQLEQKVSDEQRRFADQVTRTDVAERRNIDLSAQLEAMTQSLAAADRVIAELRSALERQQALVVQRDEDLQKISRESFGRNADLTEKIFDLERQLNQASALVAQGNATSADLRSANERLKSEVESMSRLRGGVQHEMQVRQEELQMQLNEANVQRDALERQFVVIPDFTTLSLFSIPDWLWQSLRSQPCSTDWRRSRLWLHKSSCICSNSLILHATRCDHWFCAGHPSSHRISLVAARHLPSGARATLGARRPYKISAFRCERATSSRGSERS